MLLFNFLCLFYLMVLINSYTISKSIAKDDEIINVIDSVRDLENDKEHEIKQNRFHIRNAFRKDTSKAREKWSTNDNVKLDVSTSVTDNVNLKMNLKDKSNQILVSKSRRKGFFGRLLDKIKRKRKKNYMTNKLAKQVKTTVKHADRVNSNENVSNENGNSYLTQRDRIIRRSRLPKRQVYTLKNKEVTVTDSDGLIKRYYWSPENFIWRPYYPFTAIRTYTPVIQKHEMSLSEMTTKINYLKELYGMTPRGFSKFMSIMTNPILNYNWNQEELHQESTTPLQIQEVDIDSLETSQIEQLLKKMKMKAFEEVTVSTERIVENYPLSYGIPREKRRRRENKRKKLERGLESNARNKLNYGSVDDLKKVYAKVKNQLSKEIKMSENAIKNETHYWAKKLKNSGNVSKVNKTNNKVKHLFDAVGNAQNREKKLSYFKYDRNEMTTVSTTSQLATDDDYSLISKCEQLLQNAYQTDNVPDLTSRREKNYFDRNNQRPIRNSNFIAPVYENPDNISNNTPAFKYKTDTEENYPKVTTTYKELADKLHYNDYVNGYKHYLKFQKEQGEQNYSNLIRYQAHRHHNVDDIGKFILEKIPRVPDRHVRAFYDESATTEDQDISTKSEESWFKKHFYLFIDSGPPKKYHSSQTVSMRPTATKTEKLNPRNKFIKDNQKHSGDTDLDSLTNILDVFKSHLVPPAKNSLKNRISGKSENKSDKKLDKLKFSTVLDPNPLVQEQSRLKRNKHHHVRDKEYQVYRSYLPKPELSSRKELSQEDSSPTLINRNERDGYVDVSLVTQPTAVLKQRNAKHGSVLKTFLNHFRLPFHKKKAKEMTKSTTQQNSPRKVRCLNPLKKLKKMFNVHIDGKPIIPGSKIFDCDIINAHIDPYRQINYDKQFVNLDDEESKIPTAIPEISNLTGFLKDKHFDTSIQQVSLLAQKYYKNHLDNIASTETFNNNEMETSTILVDAKTNPPQPTQTGLKTKNKADFQDSELINIKITTVKNFDANSYSLPSLSSVYLDNDKIIRHEQGLTGKFKKNVPKFLSSNRHFRFKHETEGNSELQNVEETLKLNNRKNFEEDRQKSKQVLRTLNQAVKIVTENAKSSTLSNKIKRNSKPMYRYKVTPDYFNDLEIWHNDILNSENYTTWQNILRSLQTMRYRPPNANILRKELDSLNIRMGDMKENVTKAMTLNENFSKTTGTAVTKEAPVTKNLVRREFNRNQPHGRVNVETVKYLKSERNHKKISNLNITATTVNQHHFSDNINYETKKLKLKTDSSTEKYSDTIPDTTLSLDSTLLAYDDSLNLLTDTSEKPTSKSSLNPHALDPVNFLTKLHKVPQQYFSTPLPMDSENFDVFLREHNIDVESVTSPLNFSCKDPLLNRPQSNEETFKGYDKTMEIAETIIGNQKTTFRSSTSAPLKKIGRYFKNELENNIKDKLFDVSHIPKNHINDERSRREIYKYLHIAASKPDYLLAGIYSKYSKFRNHFKNVDRGKCETVHSRNFTTKPNSDDDTEYYIDILENRPEPDDNDITNNNNAGPVTDGKSFKDVFGNRFNELNLPQTSKYLDLNPFENRTNVNISGISRKNPDVNGKTNLFKKHKKVIDKKKLSSNFTHLVHNNLLFNYMYDNVKKGKVTKYNDSHNLPYNINDTNVAMKSTVTPGDELNLPTTNGLGKLYTNPKRIHVSSKTMNYDIIFDDYDTTNKHSTHKLDERHDTENPHDDGLEHKRSYLMGAKESTSDSEDEQIKELVRVVEAVDNFTRPNVLLYVNLPTYYLPDTNSTDPTPIRSPPKSFWNDFILKYVSGIALIELLTKFGILKTVETNFSDGMDEDVNKCGRFSGTAEPSLAMDLKPADSIRRVLRSETDDMTTEMSTSSSLEPVKKGTMVYDLKQLGRPHTDSLKSRIGLNRKGTSILSLLLRQGKVPVRKTTHIVIPWSTNKSTTENPKEDTTITSITERHIKDKETKEENLEGNDNNERNLENIKTSKSTGTYKQEQSDATTTKLTTVPLKLFKAFGTVAIHTPQGKEKEHVTTRASSHATAIKSKETLKTSTGDYRFYLATTKLLPKESAKTSHKEINVKISTSANVAASSEDNSNEAKITTVLADESPVTKATTISSSEAAPVQQKALNMNKASDIELLTSIIIPELGPTVSDFNTTQYDDSYYVTSNYYDYNGINIGNNYNELENKNATLANVTHVKENSNIKHDKRDLKSQNTFTAKDVAAIEVIVDLLRHNRNSDNNDVNAISSKLPSAFVHPLNPSLTASSPQTFRKSDLYKNSIQVHIAIPCNLTIEKRRSLNEPVRIRKVFSARLSTPVDMEYQIHSVEDLESLSTVINFGSFTTAKTPAASDKFSPGLYVLVENKNRSLPDGQFILKPVYNNNLLFDYTARQVPKDVSTEKITSAQPSNLSKVTLSKDFIAAINKHLFELYRNLVVTPNHDIEERKLTTVNATLNSSTIDNNNNNNRQRRSINWDTIKKYFGRENVCSCHCKPNRTMCRACAASDAVISELIFELDNLAKYMSDHCTEIQTYFWMNPSGGRRLRDAVQRIDKALYDYFKRVRGKCKGRPCKVFTSMDKRHYINVDKKPNYIGDALIQDVERVADNLEKASKYNIGDKKLLDTGNKCLDAITKCMHLRPFNKRAHENDSRRVKNVYSLDNVNVNIICKTDKAESTHNNVYYSSTRSTSYLTEPPNIFYYDDTDDYTKENKHKKGFKALLKRKGYFKNKRKNKKHWFSYNVTSSVGNENLKLKKREAQSNHQMEIRFLGHNKGSMWNNFLKAYKSSSVEESNPKDNGYLNFDTNHYITNLLNISYTIKNTSHNPNNVDKQNRTVNVYPYYEKDFNSVTEQTKTKSNFKPYGPVLGKIYKNPLRSSSSLNNIHDMDNFESIQDVTDFNINNIEIKKKLDVRHEIDDNRKIQNNDHSKVSSLTTTTNTKLENVKTTHQNFLQRIKAITLNFLNGLQLDEKSTTPIYKSYKSTQFKRDINNSPNTIKGNVKAKVDKDKVLSVKIDYPLDLSVSEKDGLQSDLDESIDDKRELLLSILDFKTNKLNKEWEQVALKKAPNEDEDQGNQSIFEIHSEIPIPPRKSSSPKIEHTITASNPHHKNKHKTTHTHKCKTNRTKTTNKTAITTPTTPCKKKTTTCEKYAYYDIKKDLPEIELSVPPELATTRVYHGLLDKIISQFRFRIVPKTQKVAKSHSCDPKGRSFKRKPLHGYRFPGKQRYRTSNRESQSSRDGVRPGALQTPGTIVIRIVTKLAPVSDTAEQSQGQTTHKTTQLTLSTTPRNELKTKPSNMSVSTKESKTEKKSKQAEETRQSVNYTKPIVAEEAFDSGSQDNICDIDATMIHILNKYKVLPVQEFKRFVKNVTCFKYMKKPSIFRIKAKVKKKSRTHVRSEEDKRRKWNWVRGKRSSEFMKSYPTNNINNNEYDYFDDHKKYENDEIRNRRDMFTNTIRNDMGDYDRLYLGGDGIYRGQENERKKRTVDMTNVISGLRSLPPLRELVDEVFVIRGNPVTIFCNVSGTPLYSISNLTNMYRYSWVAERKSMLSNQNLKIVGPSLVINDVQPKNYGTYTCCQDRIVTRSVRLNVIEIPNFKIIFTPIYRCLGECTYEDLENIQCLGTEMMKSANCCGLASCTIRVDNPVAYSNKENEDMLKPTIVITAVPPQSIECDPECLRDLTCSLALLWAANAPSLAFVKVVIMYEKFNNTLTPVDSSNTNMNVLKTLKNRDSNGHREYVDLSLNMSPGDVDVVVVCPAGFYLLTEQKICAVCPANTCAAEGENTCSACPRGTHSEPGSAACRLGLGRLHRYVENCSHVSWQWWASGCCLGCLSLCLLVGFWLCRRSTARPASERTKPYRSTEYSDRWLGVKRHGRRPLSPSRVLLERIYKRSQSSFLVTDSQETKFVVKQMKIPPPVPPIDFD